jgi:hypothetical protein
MGFFKPLTGRQVAEYANSICQKWDSLTPEEKASGEYIDPDEPVVIAVPNPQWKGTDDCYNDDEQGNKWLLHFHMQSYGGGDDMDDDGNECGHDGAEIVCMAMEQSTSSIRA